MIIGKESEGVASQRNICKCFEVVGERRSPMGDDNNHQSNIRNDRTLLEF
jgi:hypothetical protein